jgi:hypothetical protein
MLTREWPSLPAELREALVLEMKSLISTLVSRDCQNKEVSLRAPFSWPGRARPSGRLAEDLCCALLVSRFVHRSSTSRQCRNAASLFLSSNRFRANDDMSHVCVRDPCFAFIPGRCGIPLASSSKAWGEQRHQGISLVPRRAQGPRCDVTFLSIWDLSRKNCAWARMSQQRRD